MLYLMLGRKSKPKVRIERSSLLELPRYGWIIYCRFSVALILRNEYQYCIMEKL